MSPVCKYCEYDGRIEEMRFHSSDFVCRDGKACDEREEAAYKLRLRELRKRLPDELTEAERAELADAR